MGKASDVYRQVESKEDERQGATGAVVRAPRFFVMVVDRCRLYVSIELTASTSKKSSQET
jgi:hypothetical protein